MGQTADMTAEQSTPHDSTAVSQDPSTSKSITSTFAVVATRGGYMTRYTLYRSGPGGPGGTGGSTVFTQSTTRGPCPLRGCPTADPRPH